MSRFLYPLGFALGFAFTMASCTSDEGGGSNNANTPAPLPMVTPEQVERTDATQGITIDPSTNTVGGPSGSPRLNPAHGEPGHVCEIPVGAPLDGSGGGAGNPTQSITIDPNSQSGAQSFSTAPPTSSPVQMGGSGKINPPHGEPGHVCEVPVGDPLP